MLLRTCLAPELTHTSQALTSETPQIILTQHSLYIEARRVQQARQAQQAQQAQQAEQAQQAQHAQ